MNPKLFCNLHSQFFGEPTDSVKQVAQQTFTGEELYEFCSYIFSKAIKLSKEQLLKQTHVMSHSNGYPSEAVPKATILSLEPLVKTIEQCS